MITTTFPTYIFFIVKRRVCRRTLTFSQYFLSLYFSPDGELICPSLDEEEEYYDDYYGGQEDEECVEDANVQVMVRFLIFIK